MQLEKKVSFNYCFSNHFFAILSSSPFSFICFRTLLKSSTRSEPFGTMADPASLGLLRMVVNNKYGLLSVSSFATKLLQLYL